MKKLSVFILAMFLCMTCYGLVHILPKKPVPSHKLYICAEEIEENVDVSITGVASKTLSPDCASIFACLKSEGELVNGTINNNQYKNMLNSLFDCGVMENDIRLNSSSCYPMIKMFGQGVNDYCCCHNFTIKVCNLEKVQCVVDTLNNYGAEIFNLTYCVSNIEEEYSSIIESAIEDAKNKANNILVDNQYEFVDVKEKSVFYNSNISGDVQDAENTLIEISGRVEAVFQQKNHEK